ncbi:MAG: cytochrome c biogenesis protein ResB [Anaerolineae bacterium]|jgi:hypothetical protein
MAEQPSRREHLWRILWRLAAGDRSLAAILVGTAIAIALVLAIPQRPPTLSESGPWLAQVRVELGWAMPVFNALGLFTMGNSLPFRLLVFLLALVLLVRATDRVIDLIAGQRVAGPESDDEAWRALPREDLETTRRELRKRGYRVESPDEGDGILQADRWPAAEALALLAHLGPVLIVLGLLIGVVWGWQVNPLHGKPGETIDLPRRGQITVPEFSTSSQARLDGMRLYVEGAMPELTVSATSATSEPLGLIQTPEAEPAEQLSFRLNGEMPSTHFAIPEAALFVRVTLDPEAPAGADAPILTQVFRIRSGEQVAESTISGPNDRLLAADGVEIKVHREPYLVLTAAHDPGYGVKILGLLTTAVALMGRILWPPRRLWIRESTDGLEVQGRTPPWLLDSSQERGGARRKSAVAVRLLVVALAPFVAGLALWNLGREGVLWAGAPLQIGITAFWLLALAIWLVCCSTAPTPVEHSQTEKEGE